MISTAAIAADETRSAFDCPVPPGPHHRTAPAPGLQPQRHADPQLPLAKAAPQAEDLDADANAAVVAGEPGDDAERLLKPVIRAGSLLPGAAPPLSEIWELARRNLERLPDRYRRLEHPDPYPVRYSDALKSLAQAARAAAEHRT